MLGQDEILEGADAKKPPRGRFLLEIKPSDDLLSHNRTLHYHRRTLHFTSVFGMGTGGSAALWSLGNSVNSYCIKSGGTDGNRTRDLLRDRQAF